MLMVVVCWVALVALWWWAAHKPSRLAARDLERLRRMADEIHREQAQPFE